MFELPLFPLNTVLFPGMPTALHIFEDRYKLMIGKCIQERTPFGVVLIKEGAEASGPLAKPHTVGCLAQITQVERLELGRMNIGIIGRERFKILSLDHEMPYLRGQVERFPLEEGDPEKKAAAARNLRPFVLQYMETLSKVEGVALDPAQLPEEPETLAFMAATLLQAPAEQKQPLLSEEKVIKLLADLRTLYRQEVALLKVMLAGGAEDQGTFSMN